MKIQVFALSMVTIFSFCGLVSAEDMAAQEASAVAVEQASPVVVGNKVCPVLGNEIPEDQLGQNTVEYNGKIYNLCCPMCKEKFLSDAEKYSKVSQDSAVVDDVEEASLADATEEDAE
ncbi:MAG: hypothetical protein HQL21_05135 [Candidatus Omnitrophica bacterium]|nr:hypothetical protein [Candidatus Omnitrophota bacterium]